MKRRNFLNVTGTCVAGAALANWSGLPRLLAQTGGAQRPSGMPLAEGVPNAEKLGWRVGVQIYTFNRWTLFEAIDMTASLGLKYLATYWGQRISHDIPERIGTGLSPDLCKVVKAKIAEAGLVHASHYEQLQAKYAPQVFEFWRDMGIEMLISDPKRISEGDGSVEFYDQLAQDSGVKVALTNHPRPAPYWNPDQVMEDCRGRSEMIGASIDPGHFMRGGFEPLPIVKQYIDAGRLIQFDFRDVDGLGPQAKDVPMGEGKADIKAILSYVHAKGLKPLFSIEYERDFENPMAQMVPSVNYLNEICGELLAKQWSDKSSAHSAPRSAGRAT